LTVPNEAPVPPVAQDLAGAFLQDLLNPVTATSSMDDQAFVVVVHNLFGSERVVVMTSGHLYQKGYYNTFFNF
jgi:hypothetical protein